MEIEYDVACTLFKRYFNVISFPLCDMHKRVEKKEFINMLCMNVFVFLCVCADIWVVMDTNLEARVQPQFHSTYSMRQTLSLNLELTSSVRLAGQ